MPKPEGQKESKTKTARKSWYKVMAPKSFGQRELGETYLASPESAVGRTLRYNLKELTGNVKDQNAYVFFRIDRAAAALLHTLPVGYELSLSSIKRMVKKNTTRLDDYFAGFSKDNKQVVVKSIIITGFKVQRSVGQALRRELQDTLRETLQKEDFAAFIGSLAGGKLRSERRKRLPRIYPLKEVTVRMVELKETGTRDLLPAAEEAVPAAEMAEPA